MKTPGIIIVLFVLAALPGEIVQFLYESGTNRTDGSRPGNASFQVRETMAFEEVSNRQSGWSQVVDRMQAAMEEMRVSIRGLRTEAGAPTGTVGNWP